MAKNIKKRIQSFIECGKGEQGCFFILYFSRIPERSLAITWFKNRKRHFGRFKNRFFIGKLSFDYSVLPF
jgi:hypothetical protein